MSYLKWGTPTLEASKLGDDGATTTWIPIDIPVIGTTKLTVTKGEKKEAKVEGGDVIDTRVGKSTYSLEFELYAAKGKSKPIEDTDGVILDNYAVRLTPEDETLEGFIIDKSSVSVETTWDADNGEKWKYTFDALKPKSGKILKPYIKTETVQE